VLLMDIRHPLTDFDQNMLRWAKARELAVHIVLTKADKLSRGPALNTLQAVQRDLTRLKFKASVQLFSALKIQGLETLADTLGGWLDYPPAEGDNPLLTAEELLTIEAKARLS
jgi:GTP-binding protein